MGSHMIVHKRADIDGPRAEAYVVDPKARGGLRLSSIVDPETVIELANDVKVGSEKPYPLAGVDLVGGAPKEWQPSREYIDTAIAEGWASLGKGEVKLHFANGEVTYAIAEPPGQHEDEDGNVRVSNEWSLVLATETEAVSG